MYEAIQGTRLPASDGQADPADSGGSDLLQRMTRAFRCAHEGRLGKRWIPGDVTTFIEPILAHELGMRPGSGVAHAVRAAFYLGLRARRGSAPPVSDLQDVLIQQELVLALLGLEFRSRRILHNRGHAIGSAAGSREWRSTYSGSLGVARVARLMTRLGFETWLPPIGHDMHDKIDLIASDPLGRGFCIQVKNCHSTDVTSCRPMRHDTREARDEPDPYVRQFLRGVRTYAHCTVGQWTGLYLVLGSQGLDPAELDAYPGIQQAICEGVAKVIPSTAAQARKLGFLP